MGIRSVLLSIIMLIMLAMFTATYALTYAQIYTPSNLHKLIYMPQPRHVVQIVEKHLMNPLAPSKNPLAIKRVSKHKYTLNRVLIKFRPRFFNITGVAKGSAKVVVPSPLQVYYVGKDPRKGIATKGYWSWQDYPFWVPKSKPIVVTIFDNVSIGNYTGPITKTVNLTSLNGLSFSRILLRVNVYLNSSVPGRPAVQYDRPLWIWIDGVPAFVGTTTQRYNYTAIVDVTYLYNLIVGKVFNVTLNLYNCVLPSYGLTGVFYVTVELLLYPGPEPSSIPTIVIPLFTPSTGRFAGLAYTVLSRNSEIETHLSIPFGASRAVLILYAEGAAWDEFWYAWMPPDRYIYIYSDGNPIAIIQPFPYIYTGGINPFLWRPQPAIRTLAFYPFVADLSGLLPMIVGNHTLKLRVVNGLNRWYVFAAIALYYEPEARGYKLVSYSVTSEPIITRNVNVPVGAINGVDIVYHYIRTSYTSLEASTIIYLPNCAVVATTTMYNGFDELQSYDEEWIWQNISLSQVWHYETTYKYYVSKFVPPETLALQLSYGTQKFEFSWKANLDIVYGFMIYNIRGNIEQASLQHPVYANFTMITAVTQYLHDLEQPFFATSTLRNYEGIVSAASSLTGTIAFIGPTAALIENITKWYGDTWKKVFGNELSMPLFGSKMINFERITHSHVYMQQPYYRVLSDFIIIEWH